MKKVSKLYPANSQGIDQMFDDILGESPSQAAQRSQRDIELERMTGEPHVDGWPLYSGLPPSQKDSIILHAIRVTREACAEAILEEIGVQLPRHMQSEFDRTYITTLREAVATVLATSEDELLRRVKWNGDATM